MIGKVLSRYRKSINPPWNLKDYLNLIVTFSILLGILLVVAFSHGQPSLQSRAQTASDCPSGYPPTSGDLIVKVCTISPTSGPNGTILTLTGTGFYDPNNPNYGVGLCFRVGSGCINAYAVATSDSQIQFTVPGSNYLAPGTYSMFLQAYRGSTQSLEGSNSFTQQFTVTGIGQTITPTPTLLPYPTESPCPSGYPPTSGSLVVKVCTISPTSGPNGTIITLTGTGFYDPNNPTYGDGLCFRVGSGCVNAYAVATSDSQIQFTIPPSTLLPPGTYSMFLQAYRGSTEHLNGDNSFTQQFTVTPTVGPLTIYNVQIKNFTMTSATVTWTTSGPGTSRVAYGTSSKNQNQSSPLDQTLATNHAVNLNGLRKNTMYYYRVYSRNSAGSEFSSPVQSFKTLR